METNTRREFLRTLGASGPLVAGAFATTAATSVPNVSDDSRDYWLAMLRRVSEPVLANIAVGKLRERMPIECPTGNIEQRRKVTHLEALGRTLTGIAPWLELQGVGGDEARLQSRFRELALCALAQATDPKSPDFMPFGAGAQNLVDAAFLAHALLRARGELWQKLEPPVQRRVTESMRLTRKFKPGQNNWLLFAAMVETFLARAGANWEAEPIEVSLRAHESWYKGDGVYGDGAEFHWDYYNSFVIQPMLIDVLEHIGTVTDRWAALRPNVLTRAQRYAAVQERLIATDGSYPVMGRSVAYRCGAFQLLAQIALRRELPEGVSPAQVRGALAASIRRTLSVPDTFDKDGWLQIGLAGRQPGLAETYIGTGSLYLCSAVFLPLGLPATDPFWSAASAEWTARKAWSGQNLMADHALRT